MTFCVSTEVSMKIGIFWNATPCMPVDIQQLLQVPPPSFFRVQMRQIQKFLPNVVSTGMFGVPILRIKQHICEGINKSHYNLSHIYSLVQIQSADIQNRKYGHRYYGKNLPMNTCN